MKLRWRAPRPDEDAPAHDEVLDPDAPPAPQWTGGQDLKTRGVRAGLWTALAAGPAAVVLLLTGAGATAAPPTATVSSAPAVDSNAQAAAGEFAAQLVVTWLQATRGQEAQLAAFVDADGIQLADVASRATSPATAGITTTAPGQYTVVVAVTVSAATPATAAATSAAASAGTTTAARSAPAAGDRRYFQVPVVTSPAGMRAATLPTPVAAPAESDGITLSYGYRVPTGHPTVATVSQFLSALLAGGSDVSRYESPGASIRAITPAPYTAVKVLDAVATEDFTAASGAPADGKQVRLLATAALTATTGQEITTQYPLTLTARAGRWEVSVLDQAPPLRTPTARPSSSVAPTTEPTATATTSRSAPDTATTTPAAAPSPTTTVPDLPAAPSIPAAPLVP